MEQDKLFQYKEENYMFSNSLKNTQITLDHLDTIPEEIETSSINKIEYIRNIKRSGTQIRIPNKFDKNKIIKPINKKTFNLYQTEFNSKIFLPKRSNSFSELKNSYKNMINKTNIDDFILINFKEKNQNNDDNNSVSSKSSENENDILNDEEYKKKFEQRKRINRKNIITIRSKSVSVEKGISEYYIEEDETDIEKMQLKPSSKLKCISLNLMLKEIIFNEFLIKYALNVYHFSQQCFAFIKKEILFKKIWNCYLYYKRKDIPFDKLKNLFDFLGILVIEMYDYYKVIKKNDLILKIIKNMYYQIISDLIINLDNYNESKFGRSTIYNAEFIGKNFFYESDNKILNLIKHFSNNKNDVIKHLDSEEEINSQIEKNSRISINKEEINTTEIDNIESINTFNSNNFNTENSGDILNIKTYESDDCINAALIQNYLYENDNEFNRIINSFEQKHLNISNKEELLCNFSSILKILESERPLLSDLINAKKKILFYEALKMHTLKNEKETNNRKRNDTNEKPKRSSSAMNVKKAKEKAKNIKKYLQQGFFSMMDWETSEIGEILIKRTRNLFNKIERKEFYNSVFLKKDKNILSPNIQNATKKMNDLSTFIIEDILSYNQKDDRAKTIEKWTLVAEYCKNKRDYNDCIAINSAFQNYIITGLKKTYKKIGKNIKNIMEDINDFCSIEGNYKYIREEMKKIINAGESFYPYLGLLTKDIVYDDEKSKYLIDQENINFEKIENIQKMLDNNFQYKTNLKSDDEIKIIPELNFFENLELTTKGERELEQLADKLEPELLLDEKIIKRKTKIDEKYFYKFKLNRINSGKKQIQSNNNIIKINI